MSYEYRIICAKIKRYMRYLQAAKTEQQSCYYERIINNLREKLEVLKCDF